MIHDVRISSISFVLSICVTVILMGLLVTSCSSENGAESGDIKTVPSPEIISSEEELVVVDESDVGILEVTSSSLPEGKYIPIEYTCAGGYGMGAGYYDTSGLSMGSEEAQEKEKARQEAISKGSSEDDQAAQEIDISPSLTWSAGPQGTESFAIIFEDPDTPVWEPPVVHWVVYNIPLDVTHLDEDVPHEEVLENGTIQGINDSGYVGYDGPCPKTGGIKVHTWVFTVYALDMAVNLKPGATKEDLLKEVSGHVLAKGELKRQRSPCNPASVICD